MRTSPRHSEIRISASTRRYLDSTFCSAFHSLKSVAAPDVVLAGGRVLVFALWGAVLLCILYQLVLSEWSRWREACPPGTNPRVTP